MQLHELEAPGGVAWRRVRALAGALGRREGLAKGTVAKGKQGRGKADRGETLQRGNGTWRLGGGESEHKANLAKGTREARSRGKWTMDGEEKSGGRERRGYQQGEATAGRLMLTGRQI